MLAPYKVTNISPQANSKLHFIAEELAQKANLLKPKYEATERLYAKFFSRSEYLHSLR
ncbi:hypothetical protein KJ695_04890 [Patescibacteria group bacterium]|nr:hypothetical protein [Patescibacteria group bacterium]MBU4057214.1 hypothetical protein [Patescibacteria group bacterium]MBU4368668.1 hypothetical protein [Patescibacteria group bacterium]